MPEQIDRLGDLRNGIPQPYAPEKFPAIRSEPRTENAKRLRKVSDRTLRRFGMLGKSGKVKPQIEPAKSPPSIVFDITLVLVN